MYVCINDTNFLKFLIHHSFYINYKWLSNINQWITITKETVVRFYKTQHNAIYCYTIYEKFLFFSIIIQNKKYKSS